MIWLSTSTIARLRDRLRAQGQRSSVALAEEAELATVTAEYGPICEAMYLMMSADGNVTADEREVLKGALRNLSGDSVHSAYVDAMLDVASAAVTAEGRDARLREVIAALREDAARAEVAFVLAAAIAFADNAIADEENETLNSFAEGLGIDESRVQELLDSVEADLAERPGPSPLRR